MGYWPRRPPQRKRPEPSRPSPLPAELVAEFHDRELGSHGEMLPVPAPAAPAPPIMGLQIPPPPWKGREAGLAIDEPEPTPTDELSALEQMKLNDDGYEPEPWRPPAPPIQPLVPVTIPEPNWREEERLRARTEREEHALDEEQPAPHPPVRREPA